MGRRKVETIQHEWSDKWVDLAVKVMATGASAARVAKAINQVFNVQVTRNSVIGKINRLKASGDDRFDKLPPMEKIHGKPVSHLLSWWEDGMPSHEIGDYYGIHRNTVGKKAAEYGLEPRDPTFASKSAKAKRDANISPEKKREFIFKAFQPKNVFGSKNSRGVSLLELERNQCRFVIGDGPYLFCGLPLKPGSASSYCPDCHKIVYVPTQPTGFKKAKI